MKWTRLIYAPTQKKPGQILYIVSSNVGSETQPKSRGCRADGPAVQFIFLQCCVTGKYCSAERWYGRAEAAGSRERMLTHKHMGGHTDETLTHAHLFACACTLTHFSCENDAKPQKKISIKHNSYRYTYMVGVCACICNLFAVYLFKLIKAGFLHFVLHQFLTERTDNMDPALSSQLCWQFSCHCSQCHTRWRFCCSLFPVTPATVCKPRFNLFLRVSARVTFLHVSFPWGMSLGYSHLPFPVPGADPLPALFLRGLPGYPSPLFGCRDMDFFLAVLLKGILLCIGGMC